MLKNGYGRLLRIIIIFVILVAIAGTGVNFILFRTSVIDSDIDNEEIPESYKYHFAMVVDSTSVSKWQETYDAANKYAKENNAYVEMTGANLSQNYTKEELFRVALLSGVDGIIVEGDESDRLNLLISEAYDNNIPVVTIMTDAPGSQRSSFVGIGSYNVGQELGKQIIKLSKKKKKPNILVMMNNSDGYQEQHTMYQAIVESISSIKGINIDTWTVNNNNDFGIDEEVRDIILNLMEEPDIMVCLSDKITESAYQQVVEYNKVDSIDILGLASSDMVYEAVSKKLIDSVISFDKKKMGNYIVDALLEYKKNGYVSEYYKVDTNLVTSSNAGGYINNEAE